MPEYHIKIKMLAFIYARTLSTFVRIIYKYKYTKYIGEYSVYSNLCVYNSNSTLNVTYSYFVEIAMGNSW